MTIRLNCQRAAICALLSRWVRHTLAAANLAFRADKHGVHYTRHAAGFSDEVSLCSASFFALWFVEMFASVWKSFSLLLRVWLRVQPTYSLWLSLNHLVRWVVTSPSVTANVSECRWTTVGLTPLSLLLKMNSSDSCLAVWWESRGRCVSFLRMPCVVITARRTM